MVISSGDFSGAHLSFAKKGLFFDFFRFFLENGCPNMSETSIFWKYIQFAIEWYIICLYMIKIEASRFFSQKSTNCPMGRSSLFEPCHTGFITHSSNVSTTLRGRLIYQGLLNPEFIPGSDLVNYLAKRWVFEEFVQCGIILFLYWYQILWPILVKCLD